VLIGCVLISGWIDSFLFFSSSLLPFSSSLLPFFPSSLLPFSAFLRIRVTFITQEGDCVHVKGTEGQNVLELAHENDIDLEGACEGSLACSTCHVVVDPTFYARLGEPTDEENDMLDLAFGLTETYVVLWRRAFQGKEGYPCN
jgi:ferredoxin